MSPMAIHVIPTAQISAPPQARARLLQQHLADSKHPKCWDTHSSWGDRDICGENIWMSWEVPEFMVIYYGYHGKYRNLWWFTLICPLKMDAMWHKPSQDLTLKNDRTIHGNNGDFMGFYDILWVWWESWTSPTICGLHIHTMAKLAWRFAGAGTATRRQWPWNGGGTWGGVLRRKITFKHKKTLHVCKDPRLVEWEISWELFFFPLNVLYYV